VGEKPKDELVTLRLPAPKLCPWSCVFGSKRRVTLLRDRWSSRVSIKEEPYHKEHERDQYQQGEQVQEDGEGEDHDYQDDCHDYDIR
jgi:hypothetical protein